MASIPPGILSRTLLTRIRRQPHLPPHTWYLITGITLSALNRADAIPAAFKHALETGGGLGPPSQRGERDVEGGEMDWKPPTEDEQLVMARRMREALVKGAVIGGLPKAINALTSLKTATPVHLLDLPSSPSSPSSSPPSSPTLRPADIHDVPTSAILARGQAFFDRVYGKVSQRVMGQMDRSGTEDLGLVARLMYGYVLSNTQVLDARDSSLVLVAGLIPQDVNPQLKGHLKGALNNGATVDEVKAVRAVVLDICKASGMTRLPEDGSGGGWGWRGEVANL